MTADLEKLGGRGARRPRPPIHRQREWTTLTHSECAKRRLIARSVKRSDASKFPGNLPNVS